MIDQFLELRTWVEFKNGLHDPPALDLFVVSAAFDLVERADLRSISPASIESLWEKLSQIRDLRVEKLIDDEVAVEYQRRLLDELVKLEKQ